MTSIKIDIECHDYYGDTSNPNNECDSYHIKCIVMEFSSAHTNKKLNPKLIIRANNQLVTFSFDLTLLLLMLL